jgi:hypothetical protein
MEGKGRTVIDDRAVEWMHLLPPPGRFVFGRVPEALPELLTARRAAAESESTGKVGAAYVGRAVRPEELPALAGYQSLVLLNPRGLDLRALRAAGFGHTLAYCAYPSLDRVRLLLPLNHARAASRGLDFMAAAGSLARLKQAVLIVLARAGQLKQAGDTLILARHGRSELEASLADVTGLSRMCLAVSVGNPGPYRKLTIQVASVEGRVVAYAKVARGRAAKESVTRESASLAALAAYPQLRGALPTVLADLEIGDTLVSVQTPGPTGLWPARFGRAHHAFLLALSESTGRLGRCSESLMWQTMRSSFAALQSQISPAWRQRLTAAIDRVETRLNGKEILLSTAHGSFTPWNTRLYPDRRLFVFDWEFAQPQSLPLYDFFHFHLTSGMSLGHRKPSEQIVGDMFRAAHSWEWGLDRTTLADAFLGYLIDRSVRRLQYRSWRMSTSSRGQSDLFLESVATILDRRNEWLVD